MLEQPLPTSSALRSLGFLMGYNYNDNCRSFHHLHSSPYLSSPANSSHPPSFMFEEHVSAADNSFLSVVDHLGEKSAQTARTVSFFAYAHCAAQLCTGNFCSSWALFQCRGVGHTGVRYRLEDGILEDMLVARCNKDLVWLHGWLV